LRLQNRQHASTVSSLGLNLYQTDGRRRDMVSDHPALDVTTFRPNNYETPFYFWESIIAQAVLKGCGYAIIRRGAGGIPIALQCLDTDHVERRIVENRVFFKLQDDTVVAQEDMLEICNLQRRSPIQLHRENLGLTQAAQNYGSEYFGNGGQMTGVLSSDQPLKGEQMETLQKSWNQSQTSAGTKLLPFGFKYNRISIAPEEAQFIETRKFQAEEICRIFSVPPALVQLESQTTYNNVEQQNLRRATKPHVRAAHSVAVGKTHRARAGHEAADTARGAQPLFQVYLERTVQGRYGCPLTVLHADAAERRLQYQRGARH
jgi:HK97 family phage portal protein